MRLEVGPAQSNRAIFLAALDVADEEGRRAFVEQACRGDAERRRAIERLLAAHDALAANPLDQAIEQLSPAGWTVKPSRASGPETDASLDIDISSHPVIDRYKLLEQIGEGGMGAVFMAMAQGNGARCHSPSIHGKAQGATHHLLASGRGAVG